MTTKQTLKERFLKRPKLFISLLILIAISLYIFLPGGSSKAGSGEILSTDSINTIIKINNPEAKKPNIVYINVDDLGFGDLSSYDSKAIKTPNIDRLSEGGVRFDNFYSCNALCSPSRFGFLTGRYPIRRGLDWPLWAKKQPVGRKAAQLLARSLGAMGLADMGKPSSAEGIPNDEITVAKALRLAGYQTSMVGKWHLGDFGEQPEYHPLNYGFDEFYGVPHSNSMRPFDLFDGTEKIESDIRDQNLDKMTRIFTEKAIEILNKYKNSTKPFFLYLAHTAPHRPLYASKEFQNKSKAGLYGDVVEELDFYVGKVLDALEENGQENNTLVIFTSDNGSWYYGSTGGLRGGKGQSFEGGFRVPMIARWPEQIEAGTKSSTPSMNIDFFPTFLKLAGLEIPQDRIIDGNDISSSLLGDSIEKPQNIFYFYHHDILEGIRVGDYKYYRKINLYKYPMPANKSLAKIAAGKLGRWPLLYNLKNDPNECYNLSDNNPEKVKQMDSLMTVWEQKIENGPLGKI